MILFYTSTRVVDVFYQRDGPVYGSTAAVNHLLRTIRARSPVRSFSAGFDAQHRVES